VLPLGDLKYKHSKYLGRDVWIEQPFAEGEMPPRFYWGPCKHAPKPLASHCGRFQNPNRFGNWYTSIRVLGISVFPILAPAFWFWPLQACAKPLASRCASGSSFPAHRPATLLPLPPPHIIIAGIFKCHTSPVWILPILDLVADPIPWQRRVICLGSKRIACKLIELVVVVSAVNVMPVNLLSW
jgi:hypothetical protein